MNDKLSATQSSVSTERVELARILAIGIVRLREYAMSNMGKVKGVKERACYEQYGKSQFFFKTPIAKNILVSQTRTKDAPKMSNNNRVSTLDGIRTHEVLHHAILRRTP